MGAGGGGWAAVNMARGGYSTFSKQNEKPEKKQKARLELKPP